jgi:hypothetical protein
MWWNEERGRQCIRIQSEWVHSEWTDGVEVEIWIECPPEPEVRSLSYLSLFYPSVPGFFFKNLVFRPRPSSGLRVSVLEQSYGTTNTVLRYKITRWARHDYA